MASTNFIDYVKIFCRSGAGGKGSAHLHRDKMTAKGGPDGGDGGRGGHVILKGNRNYWTLIHLKYQRHVFAGDGEGGSEARCSGADGEDKIIDVPLGTVARDAETGEINTTYGMWDKKKKDFRLNVQNMVAPATSYNDIFS